MAEALQEFVDSQGTTLRVDSKRGVLKGVKLIGLTSRNGRVYQPNALRKAQSLYEGAKVNVNHPKSGPLSPRDYQDRLGVIREVQFRESEGLFGDLHFNPKHPLAEQLVWDAEHNPRNVGVSHNVLARVTRDGQSTVVEEITHVQSVDLVADPAATLGLYEYDQEGLKWNELTLEHLQNCRPDLLEEHSRQSAESLREKLQESEVRCAGLARQRKTLELLCEHGLRLPKHREGDGNRSAAGPQTVSRAFYEMLLAIEDDSQLEQLVLERVELLETAGTSSKLNSPRIPRSVDQIALQSQPSNEPEGASAFAKAIQRVGSLN